MTDYTFLPDPPPPGPALKPVRVKPGPRPPTIDPAKEYLLLVGRGPHVLTVSGAAGTPLIIRAEETLAGNTRGEGCGLLLKDGSAHVRIEGVKATGNVHGIRLRGVEDVVVVGCEMWKNGIEGFICGAGKRVLVDGCKSWENGTRSMEAGVVGDKWTSDKNHGYYFSFHGEDNELRNSESWANTGLGVHCNGTADESGPPLRRLAIRHCILRGNGSGGSGNLDLNYLVGATIEDTLIRGGNGLLATWADGAGTKFGAKGVVVRRSTLYEDNPSANHGVRLEAGGEVTFEACIIGGPQTKDASSKWTFDAQTRRGSLSEASAWVEPGSLKSRLPGIGWQG